MADRSVGTGPGPGPPDQCRSDCPVALSARAARRARTARSNACTAAPIHLESLALLCPRVSSPRNQARSARGRAVLQPRALPDTDTGRLERQHARAPRRNLGDSRRPLVCVRLAARAHAICAHARVYPRRSLPGSADPSTHPRSRPRPGRRRRRCAPRGTSSRRARRPTPLPRVTPGPSGHSAQYPPRKLAAAGPTGSGEGVDHVDDHPRAPRQHLRRVGSLAAWTRRRRGQASPAHGDGQERGGMTTECGRDGRLCY